MQNFMEGTNMSKVLTANEFSAFVESLIIENFGSLEAFVEAFPDHFEVVLQESNS